MREHQIVITLKPEQFLEVQRMARVAGAKSMGMFVRHRLLVALGIESSPVTPTRLTAGPDVKRITGELRRLHGELKAFVAESLAAAYIGPQEASLDSAAFEGSEIAGLAYGFLPGEPGSVATTKVEQTMAEFEHANEELERLAQRAFAISPRLGPMETFEDPGKQAQSGRERAASGDRDPLDELLDDQLSTRIIESAQSEPAPEIIETQQAEEEEEAEEEIFDVPLPMTEKTRKKQTTPRRPEEPPPAPPPPPPPPPPGPLGGSPPGGMSGGPPPRKR